VKSRSSKLLLVGGLGAAIAGAGVVTLSPRAFTATETTPQISAPKAPPVVAVSRVTRRDLSRKVSLVAELVPYQADDVYAKVSGYLKTITVDYGDHVKAGQVIATLELPEEEADLARLQAAYRIAKLDYDRIQKVTQKTPGLLAQAEVDKAQATFEMAKANIDHADALLAYSTIRAPFDGIVVKRFVDPGALIQVGTNSATQAIPLVRVSDNYRLRLVFQTPESMAEQVAPGTPVTVTIQATGERLQSKVARLSDAVTPDTRTMHTEVDIQNADLRLKPGLYATAQIDLATHDHVLAVPVAAVDSGAKPHVWMIDAKGGLEKVAVTTGIEGPAWVEITSGLHEGDMVLVTHDPSLVAGTKVTPKVVDGTPA
jgi:RND family efflux transporter MFP subunit